MNPLISVCIVTYNHKNYIKDCLDGVLIQQTKFPYEIILGEDESDDGTREICIDYANKNPDKIRLFLRSRKDVIYINGKATGRFNFIENLKASRGKYIALCEGDDYWTDPLKLQKQVDFLEANVDYAICFHNVKIFNQKTGQIEEDSISRAVEETTKIIDLARGNFIHTPSVVLRNDFKIPNWFKDVVLGDWSLYIFSIGERKIKKLNEEMAIYRVHEKGVWAVKPVKVRVENTLKTIELILSNLMLNPSVKQEFKLLKLKFEEQLNDLKSKNRKSIKFLLRSLIAKL